MKRSISHRKPVLHKIKHNSSIKIKKERKIRKTRKKKKKITSNWLDNISALLGATEFNRDSVIADIKSHFWAESLNVIILSYFLFQNFITFGFKTALYLSWLSIRVHPFLMNPKIFQINFSPDGIHFII
jgi:hypothetical protein